MGRVAYVLLAAALSAGCAGQPSNAPPVVAALPPLAEAMPLGIPTEALGTYSVEGAPFVGLVEVGGRLFFIWPERAAPIEVEKAPRGFTLRLPPGLQEPPDDGQRYNQQQAELPTTFELLPPAGEQGFRLEASWGTLPQLKNPWAERMARSGVVELENRDLSGLEELERIQHSLHLLRDQPVDELDQIRNSNDPESLKRKGGVLAYVAEQLWLQVEALQPAATQSELPELQRYVDTAKAVAYEKGTLWLPSDDAFLAMLADRLTHTEERSVIGPGSLMRVDTKDQKGVLGCDLGILLPEPTENRGRPWAPFEPPAAGRLGAFTYVLFVLQSGPRGSCDTLRSSDQAYPVRHGVYYFKLFSNAQAQIRGALFTSYMVTSLAVVKGATTAEMMQMLGANSEEVSRQAE
ncbi:MAG TPA: hypothetical protein VHP33_17000 [Polyangiaceae bacterium]|nr:hypothetical protein [Polyangiaceae bacterium]